MDILLLNETEVQRLLDPDALMDALAEGFRALSSGLVDAPKRNGVSVPNTGFLLAMPAYQQGREITVKLVSVFHDNERLGIPSHQALICLFDPETGTPLSFMDGTYITALRTAGAAALSTRLLALTDTRVLAIVGAGVGPSPGTEPGEVLLGRSPGRQSKDELTVSNAMGHACEDMAAASLVYHRAQQDGAGRTVVL